MKRIVMFEDRSEPRNDESQRRDPPEFPAFNSRLLAAILFIVVGGNVFLVAAVRGISALASSDQYLQTDGCTSATLSYFGGIGLIGLGLLAPGILIVAPLVPQFSFTDTLVKWTLVVIGACVIVGPILVSKGTELGFRCVIYPDL